MLLTTASGSFADHVQIYRLDKSTAPQPTAFDKKPDSISGISGLFVFVALFSFFFDPRDGLQGKTDASF